MGGNLGILNLIGLITTHFIKTTCPSSSSSSPSLPWRQAHMVLQLWKTAPSASKTSLMTLTFARTRRTNKTLSTVCSTPLRLSTPASPASVTLLPMSSNWTDPTAETHNSYFSHH